MACATSASEAQLARAPDVTNCRGIGDVAIDGETGTPDELITALRRKAADHGATHVIVENATNDAAHGTMYVCPSDDGANHPTRAEIRGDV